MPIKKLSKCSLVMLKLKCSQLYCHEYVVAILTLVLMSTLIFSSIFLLLDLVGFVKLVVYRMPALHHVTLHTISVAVVTNLFS